MTGIALSFPPRREDADGPAPDRDRRRRAAAVAAGVRHRSPRRKHGPPSAPTAPITSGAPQVGRGLRGRAAPGAPWPTAAIIPMENPYCSCKLITRVRAGRAGSSPPRCVAPGRRRDCHSAAPPSPFSRRLNRDPEGGGRPQNDRPPADGQPPVPSGHWSSTVVYNDSQPLSADPVPYFGQYERPANPIRSVCRGTWDPLVPCSFYHNLPRLSPQNLYRILRNFEGETLGRHIA